MFLQTTEVATPYWGSSRIDKIAQSEKATPPGYHHGHPIDE